MATFHVLKMLLPFLIISVINVILSTCMHKRKTPLQHSLDNNLPLQANITACCCFTVQMLLMYVC